MREASYHGEYVVTSSEKTTTRPVKISVLVVWSALCWRRKKYALARLDFECQSIKLRKNKAIIQSTFYFHTIVITCYSICLNKCKYKGKYSKYGCLKGELDTTNDRKKKTSGFTSCFHGLLSRCCTVLPLIATCVV